MSDVRVRKLQEFIKQEVSGMLMRGLKDPRIGFVTVTEVEVTGDLRQATIYVSLFGKDEEKKASLQALRHAAGHIRSELGKVLHLRYTPEIFFDADTSLDYSMHIESLLMINKKALKTALDKVQNIILTVHVHPDGDALGSLLAFYEALTAQGKIVTMVVDDIIPEKYNFLAHVDEIRSVDTMTDWTTDMLLVLDASTFERIGRVGELCKAPIYNIDHHISNSHFADGLYLQPEFAATGEILTDLCNSWDWPITETMANALYMAIATDCGFFRFSNTTENTLNMAALCVKNRAKPNVISEHVEVTTVARGYVDLIRNVDTVDIAILLKAVDVNVTRVSLRAKVTDVNKIAGHFGGGGHVKAAGCTIQANIDGAIEQLLAVIP